MVVLPICSVVYLRNVVIAKYGSPTNLFGSIFEKPNRLVGLPCFVMTKFLNYTTEWIGSPTIYCDDKGPQIYYRMDW